jgi:hypothetical protein
MQGVIDHGDGVDERGGERRVCVCAVGYLGPGVRGARDCRLDARGLGTDGRRHGAGPDERALNDPS